MIEPRSCAGRHSEKFETRSVAGWCMWRRGGLGPKLRDKQQARHRGVRSRGGGCISTLLPLRPPKELIVKSDAEVFEHFFETGKSFGLHLRGKSNATLGSNDG